MTPFVRIVPVWTLATQQYFTPTYMLPLDNAVFTDGTVVNTAPLQFGSSFPLMEISYIDKLINKSNNSRREFQDGDIRLKAIYVACTKTDKVFKIVTEHNVHANFLCTQANESEGIAQRMDVDFAVEVPTNILDHSFWSKLNLKLWIHVTGGICMETFECKLSAQVYEIKEDKTRNPLQHIECVGYQLMRIVL